MSLPANARVRAAPDLGRNLVEIYRFLTEQDSATAPARYMKLQAELKEARSLLSGNPASGRPARFLASLSAQGRLRAQHALRLASAAGLPELRELVVGRHVLLYAHSETEVMLLALKHQRQMTYSFAPWND
ncbi:MAG TPA: type II toxin-antitoxin system RelE/ParE family toxin [Ideonella sp.]|nr:type II toxin-antitoxin system RelE/ParE family toxin [Ideonella sp.]